MTHKNFVFDKILLIRLFTVRPKIVLLQPKKQWNDLLVIRIKCYLEVLLVRRSKPTVEAKDKGYRYETSGAWRGDGWTLLVETQHLIGSGDDGDRARNRSPSV